MSNIYLKVLRRSQTRVSGFKKIGQFWGAPSHADTIEF